MKEAAAGNMYALAELGKIYLRGKGVEKDTDKGIIYLEEAAAMGDGRAAYDLGELYRKNHVGVQEDPLLAVKWYEKAVEDSGWCAFHAAMDLASMYENGEGVAQDCATAMEWYEKALQKAPEGDNKGDAAMHTGKLYEKGQGVGQSYEKALEWYRSVLVWIREYRSKWDTEATIDTEQQVLFAIGRFYEEGLGVEQSYTEALEWYSKIFIGGGLPHPAVYEAAMRMGNIYENGSGVEKNYIEAVKWYREALNIQKCYDDKEDENIQLALKIAKLCEEGVGAEKDYKQALYIYEQLYERVLLDTQNLEQQQFRWAKYHEGQECTDELEQSKKIFRYVSEKADEIRLKIAQEYEEGQEAADYERALEWYKEISTKAGWRIEEIEKRQDWRIIYRDGQIYTGELEQAKRIYRISSDKMDEMRVKIAQKQEV